MSMLEKICAQTRIRTTHAREQTPLYLMEKQAERASAPRGFEAALGIHMGLGHASFITEIKKASPSAGVIRKNFNPAQHARDYEAAGATCLSVLTEPDFFKGNAEHLIAARNACHLPVLRKDFMVDPYQIVESRAMGADCVLIIMAALSLREAIALEDIAKSWGMDVLVEVHDRAELENALSHMQSRLIGINNRNLGTLEVRLETSEHLRALIPDDYTVICESGIRSFCDVERMRASNMHGFLVGESLMRAPDIGRALRKLRGAAC